ncbi:1,6-anhydro-N-acetylmuramyl-L-alanine amidase AmpD [Robbsia sp. Bb-Pol-6]|uniref:1,6-anhydro-N-acetylmuramyl-L-alanine amidase AmpD n=1 Tax=Robbsia betulipollinis TaxID=2981849 RepID=A0ABT3ZSP3_9BURK|nr:1,6-anhydro-N-acetylmuramyl-L-alanine amidase AmpD [Robbsia betulipollinis]
MQQVDAPVVDAAGWVSGARIVHSPNANLRPDGVLPTLLVIHNISLPPGCFGGDDITSLFTNTLDFDAHPFYRTIRGLRVSSHFLITRDGDLLQFVSTLERAWHAGVSAFAGREGCNDFSIGIELEGSDDLAFTALQYATLASLTMSLRARHPIDAIVGHADIAPGRKTDPGPYFDWDGYATAAMLPDHALPMRNP